MDPKRWERVRDLFRAGMDLLDAERATWLRGACADEEERREVESLLATHRDASGFLERPAVEWRPPGLGTWLAERYELRHELGRGGMAVVYEAWDVRLERSVAVKATGAGLFTPDTLARFEREARILARLDHASIVPVYDYGTAQDSGTAFLVMPLVAGETLRARLDARSLPANEALVLAVQLARALGYSHSLGVTHRDVKPENVLVLDGPDGREARLTDFGLALDRAETRLSWTGAILGTLAYMSPEQLSGNEVDGRSDLYSLGTVLYECLARELPFAGSPPSRLYHRIVHEAPRPLASRRVGVDPELDAIVLACLAKDPRDRPRSGEELAAALELHLGAGILSFPRLPGEEAA